MSLQHVELELDVNESAIRGQALLNAREIPKLNHHTATPTLNARVVEFIAKPGKGQFLENCVRGEIMEFLGRQKGFSGAIVLNSHQERRAKPKNKIKNPHLLLLPPQARFWRRILTCWSEPSPTCR